jgi:ABC-2 type transport system permease protein
MMLTMLVKPRILAFKNSLKTESLIRRLPFVVLGMGFWILFYMGTLYGLSYVRGLEFFGEMLSRKLFAMTFFSLMGFLILSSIITAISSFYLSKDIPFFMSMPLELRDISRLKSFESALNSSWMVLSFIPPVFIAYGVSYDAPACYYLSVLISTILFILINAGIGISVAHSLTRFFPAKRTREFLLGLGILLFLTLYFILKSLVPGDLNTPENFINTIITFRTDSPLIPSYWITELVWPMLSDSEWDFFYAAVLLSNSAFFLLLSELLGLRLYRNNLEKILPSGKERGRGFLKDIFPGRSAAILYKDLKIFFRDTGQWSQIFIIGALVMVYVYNFKTIPVTALSGVSPFIRELMVFVNLLLAGLVLSAVSARFLYASVSMEGQTFWILKAGPVEMGRFLWSKFLYGCIPVTALILFLVLFTNLAMGVEGILMWVSIGTALLLCISVSGLGTGFGAVYPKFRYDNIASVSMGLGGMTFMVLAFSVVVLTLALEALIFFLFKSDRGLDGGLHLSGKIQIMLCIALIVSVNVTAFYLPMKIGIKRLVRLSL